MKRSLSYNLKHFTLTFFQITIGFPAFVRLNWSPLWQDGHDETTEKSRHTNVSSTDILYRYLLRYSDILLIRLRIYILDCTRELFTSCQPTTKWSQVKMLLTANIIMSHDQWEELLFKKPPLQVNPDNTNFNVTQSVWTTAALKATLDSKGPNITSFSQN